jgi:hypothetical protein
MKEKYSNYSLDNQEVIPEVPKQEVPKLNKAPTFCAIRSMVDAHVKVTGAVTGKLYEFTKAGSIVYVDKQDANDILNKKRGKSCCGTGTGNSLFELV